MFGRKSSTVREKGSSGGSPLKESSKPVHTKTLSVPPTTNRPRSNSYSLSEQSTTTTEHFTAKQVEQLTQEERSSRLLHTSKARAKLVEGMHLVEHFLIVGAMPNRNPPEDYPYQTATSAFETSSSASTTTDETSQQPKGPEPKLLFQFPPNEQVNVAGIWQFAFPEGFIPQRRVRRNCERMKESSDTTRKVHHSHSHHHNSAKTSSKSNEQENELLQLASHSTPESSSVFLITGHTDLRYGVCVYKEVVAYKTDMYFVIEPLCFCVITPVPFLGFHLDVLNGLLDLPRVCELPTIPKDKLTKLLSEAYSAAQVQSPKPPNSPKLPNSDSTTSLPTTPLALTLVEMATKLESQTDVDIKKILLTLEQYHRLSVPEEGKPLDFFIMTRPRPITARRPAFDEESELLQSFGQAILFRILPTTIILQLLSAILLEYKVVLVSTHKRLLSTTILSIMPLLRPFEYQSPIIPLLPTSLFTYLEAPVPLLVGMTKQPFATESTSISNPTKAQSSATSSDGFFIINLHTGMIQCTKPLPDLPNQTDLLRQIDGLLSALSIQQASIKGIGNDISPKLFELNALGATQADMIAGLFQSYFTGLVQDFQLHCISDVGTDATTTISVFMKESFLASKPCEVRGFLQQFLDTQIFKCYEDRNLRELDRVKSEHRNSLRARRQTSNQ